MSDSNDLESIYQNTILVTLNFLRACSDQGEKTYVEILEEIRNFTIPKEMYEGKKLKDDGKTDDDLFF